MRSREENESSSLYLNEILDSLSASDMVCQVEAASRSDRVP